MWGNSTYLSYFKLQNLRLKSFRNGNWKKLNRIEKALYICACGLSRLRGKVINSKLLVKLFTITRKLLTTTKAQIIKAGEAKAKKLFDSFADKGIFNWAPVAMNWLRDPKVIFQLGVEELFGQ